MIAFFLHFSFVSLATNAHALNDMVYAARSCKLDEQKALKVKFIKVERLSSCAGASKKKLAKVKKSLGQAEAAKNNFMELAHDVE